MSQMGDKAMHDESAFIASRIGQAMAKLERKAERKALRAGHIIQITEKERSAALQQELQKQASSFT